MQANGPAIKAGCVTRRRHRPESCPDRLRGCHGARRVWRGFCRPGTKFFEFSECRDAMPIGGREVVSVIRNVGRWVLVQCCGTICLGARKLSC